MKRTALILILLLIPLVAAELVQKDTFYVGEPVIISTTNESGRVIVEAPDAKYRLLDVPGAETTFLPQAEGEHSVLLVNDAGGVIEQDAFTVAGYLTTENERTITVDEPVHANEAAMIRVTPPPEGDIRVVIEGPGGNFRYFGPWTDSPFVPVGEGLHEIIIMENDIVTGRQVVDVLPAQAPPPEVEFAITNSNGFVVEAQHTTKLVDGKIELDIQPSNKLWERLIVRGLPVNETPRIGLDEVPAESISLQQRVLKAYAVNLEMEFATATLTSTAVGHQLWKCANWNFTQQTCQGTWQLHKQLQPGEQYDITLFPGDPGYAETGVATINSVRPIYYPGETATLLAAVLDTQGFLVAGANVTVHVTTPLNSTTTYTTIPEIERGVYQIFHNTTVEGNYTVAVEAIGQNVNSSMMSQFLVLSSYAFEIGRTTPVTMDPFIGPFNTTIQVGSYIPVTTFNYTEQLPINFTNITAPGAAITSDSTHHYLTWTGLTNNSIVGYEAQPPLVTPELYQMQGVVSYDSGLFYEARPWFLAIDPTIGNEEKIEFGLAALDNTTFVLAYINVTTQDAVFEVRSTTGSILVQQTVLNTDVNLDGRIDVAPINNTHFVLNVYDRSGNNNEFWIYDRDGTQQVGQTQFDANSGDTAEISVADLGDRIVFAWSDRNNGDDLHGEIWNHTGGQIANEGNIDTDINSADIGDLQNSIDIAAVTANRWVTAWFDDNGDAIRVEGIDEAGATQIAETTLDDAVGTTGQVTAVGLRNELFALAYYDSADDDIILAIYNISGDAFTNSSGNIIVDGTPGTDSRLDIAEVEADGESLIVLSWYDQADDDIEAVVYNTIGTQLTAPFTIEANPHGTQRLIAVTGYNSLLNTGQCNGTFTVAWNNVSNAALYEHYFANGTVWGGLCGSDSELPTISLSGPASGANFTTTNITFNWTANDDKDTFLDCDLVIDGVTRTTELSPAGALDVATLGAGNGTHLWNVTCTDDFGNTNTSETRSFTVFATPFLVDEQEGVDVELTSLDNTTIVVAWIDNDATFASFEVWDMNGSVLIPQTTVDTTIDGASRIGVAAINMTHFSVAVVDGPEDDLDFWIYDRYGTQVVGPTQIDGNIGANTDVGICQMGDRFVVVNANDQDNDADYEIWSNTGTQIDPEANVDGGIAPGATLQNLVDCAAVNGTHWVYAWYDDGAADDATISSVDSAGNVLSGQTDMDNAVGDLAQIGITSLRNGRVAVGFYDSAESDITITVREMAGASFNVVLANTDVDTDAGAASRIALAEIESAGQSNFVVAWQDTTDGDIKAAVYDSDGAQVTAPTTLVTNEDATFQLVDVTGYYSHLGFGLCDGTFALAYTNSSDELVFAGFTQEGTAWNGICTPDTEVPHIQLDGPAPGAALTSSLITFNWTATDNVDNSLDCDIRIDNNVIQSSIGSPHNVSVNRSYLIADGFHYWNVTCTDNRGNANVSLTQNFTVDVATGFVDEDDAVDVSITALDNTTLVVAWIDNTSFHASFEVWDANGTLLVPEVDIDTDVDADSRIAVGPLNMTSFIISIVDGPEDDLDFWIYNVNGSAIQTRTAVEGNLGGPANDVKICQLGDRFALLDADDAGADADFEMWNNDGTNILGETAIDGNIAPDTALSNLIDCAVTNSTRWVYVWFDDNSDDLTMAIRDGDGVAIVGQTDVNTNIGGDGQVAAAGLLNERFVLAHYDSLTDDLSVSVIRTDGDVFTAVVQELDVDDTVGGITRLSAAEIVLNNESNFVVAWQDVGAGDIKAVVYSSDATQLTAPFTIESNPDATYTLLDVVGRYSVLDFGLCEGTFAVAYTNSSDDVLWKAYNQDGTAWDGICVIDTTPPVVTLNAPAGGATFSQSLITFNWTATDDTDSSLACDLVIDGAVRDNNVASPNGTPTTSSAQIGNGVHLWNVTCSDNRGNTNTSETRNFTVNAPSEFNNLSLPDLGDLGYLLYTNETHASFPLQRNWTGILSDEGSLHGDLGSNISWTRFTCSKRAPECYLVTMQTDNSIDFAVFDTVNRVWHNQTVLDANRGIDVQRGFDVACEDSGSFDCIVVYETQNGGNGAFDYRVWNGDNLSAAITQTISGAPNADFRWMELYPQKGTDIIGMALMNDQGSSTRDIYGLVWEGDADEFNHTQQLTDQASNVVQRQFDCAWEGSSREMLCAYSNLSDDLFAWQFDADTDTWTDLGNIYPGLNAQAREIELCGETPFTTDFSHDYIGVMTCDQDNDRDGGVWNGNAFSKVTAGETPAQDTLSECGNQQNDADLLGESCSFERTGDEIIFVWMDANSDFPEGGVYSVGAGTWSFSDWGGGMPIGADGVDDVEHVVTVASPGSDEIFVVDQSVGHDLSCAIWTGRSFDAEFCGDFEDEGTATGEGGFIDFDWTQIEHEPQIAFHDPMDDIRTYSYSGITSPAMRHIAYGGDILGAPPSSALSPIAGTEATNGQYTQLASQDASRYQTTITTTTGEQAYQSFKFEVEQSPVDLRSLTVFHDGYATQTTFQTADIFYFYVYNHTSDSYVLERTIDNIHDNDIHTEITITGGAIDDYLSNGDFYVLIVGNHTTAVAGDARADIVTDYIDVIGNSVDNIRSVQRTNISAIDENGIDVCTYIYYNLTNTTVGTTAMTAVNATHFYNDTNTTVIPNGLYNLTATCNETFSAENNRTITVRVDNTPPIVTSITPINDSNFTTSNVTFTWNGTDNFNGTLSCSIYIDGSLNASNIALDAGNQTNKTLIGVPDGTHTWYVLCADQAGNTNTTETRTFSVDSGPPSIVLNFPPNTHFANVSTIEFNYTPTDAVGISNCSLIIDNVVNQTNSSINNTNPNFFTVADFGDGLYNWSVNCTDLTGFEGSSATYNFTIDTSPPTVLLNTSDGSSFVNGVASLNYTAIDNIDLNMTCNITVDGSVVDTNIPSLNNTMVWRNVSLPDGFHLWNVTCADDAGNLQTSVTYNFTLTGPPFITLHLPPNTSQQNGGFVNFTYFVQDGDGIANCSLVFDNVLNQTNTTSLTVPGNNTFNLTNVNEGYYDWTVNCTDNNFEEGSADPFQVVIDNTGPTIDLNGPADGLVLDESPQYFNFTPIDNFATTMTCNLTIDGVVHSSNTNFAATNNTLTTRTQSLGNGVHLWNVSCTDEAGNFNTSLTRSFEVNVTLPLFVTVTQDKTLYQQGEIVNVTVQVANASGADVVANTTTDLIFVNLTSTGAPWWNTSWGRRADIRIEEITGADRRNVAVIANITGLSGYMTDCSSQLRIAWFDDNTTTELDRTLLGGDDATYCTVFFNANLTGGQNHTDEWFAYYNFSGAPSNAVDAGVISRLVVQRGFANGTGTTLHGGLNQAVNLQKAFVRFTANSADTSPDGNRFSSNITNTTGVAFTRYLGTAQANVSWEVISGEDLSVQRGIVGMNQSTLVVDVDISQVDMNESFIIVNGRASSTGTGSNFDAFFRGYFIDGDTIRLQRTSNTSSSNVSWQVVTWEGARVRQGTTALIAGETSETITYDSVNQSRAFPIVSWASTNDTGLDENHLQATIITDDRVTIQRQTGTSGTMEVAWFVIELPERTFVQTATNAISSDTNVGITEVDQNRTLSTIAWRSTGGGTTYTNAMVTGSLIDSSTFRLDKETTSNTNTITWYVVEVSNYSSAVASLSTPHLLIQRIINVTDGNGNQTILWDSTGGLLGNYSAVARATTDEDKPGVGSSTFGVTIDVFPPVVTLVHPPDNFFNVTYNVSFGYTVVDTGSNVSNCSLVIDNVVNQTNYTITETGQNNFSTGVLPEGVYVWTVNCSDANGNEGAATARTLTIDETAPNVTAVAPSDITLGSNDVLFNFTVTDNIDTSLFCNLTVDNGTYWANTTATNGSLTSLEITGIADGFHEWNVTCYDDTGNNATSLMLNFSLDAIPVVALNSPVNDSGTTIGNVTFEYYVTESNLSNCSLIINDAINQTRNASEVLFTDGDDLNNFTVSDLPEGIYDWTVNCTDANGFTGSHVDWTFHVDNQPPNVSLHNPLPNETFYVPSITFNFTAYDNVDTLLLCNLTINDEINQTNIAATAGVPTTVAASGFTSGNYSWNVTCADNPGFLNTSETRNYTISGDVIVTLNSPANASSDHDGNVIFSYTPSSVANFDVGGFCELLFDGTNNQTNISINNGGANYFNLTNATEGLHTWQVNCTDNDANRGGSEIWDIYFDFTNPSVVAHNPNGTLFTDDQIEFNWTATDNLDLNLTCDITVNGTVRTPSGIISPNGTPTQQTYGGFSDGYHIWNATCVDDSTRFSTSNTLNFSVQEPPLVVLNTPADGYRNNTPAVNTTYTPTDNSDTIQNCTMFLNGATNETDTSVTAGSSNTLSLFNLSHGEYNWTVGCFDPSGNYGQNDTNYTFHVDLIGPIIPTNFPTEGEFLNNNNITFNWTPVDHPGTTITCDLFVTDLFGNRSITGISGTSGTDFTQLVTNLTDGPHDWNLTCTDDLGNQNSTGIFSFTINQADLFLNASTISFDDTNPDEGQELNITVNVTNIGGVPASNAMVMFWDGDPGAGGILIGNNTATLAVNASRLYNVVWNITEGLHTIYISADPFNDIGELNETNNNGTATISFIKVNVTNPANNTITTDTTPQFSFNITDYTGANVNYTVFVDGTANGQTGNVASGVNTSIDLTALADGVHTVIIEGEGSLGRRKNSTPTLIAIDTTAPTVTFITTNATWFNRTNVTVQFNVTDLYTNALTYRTFLNGGLNATGATTNNSLVSEGLNNLAEGVYTYIVEATDALGNVANSTPLTFYVDVTPPQPNITTNNESWFNTSSPSISFNITDNLDPTLNYSFFVDGVRNQNNTVSNGVETSASLFGLSEGTHTIVVQGLDEAGHAQNSSPIVIYVDLTAPNVTLLFPPNDTNLTQTNTILNFSVEDNMADWLICNLTLDSVVIATNVNLTNGTNYSQLVSDLSSGYHYWNATCIDRASNSAISETWQFFVELPDLTITAGNITFSNSTPEENQTIQVNATVFNIGNLNATNITVQFYLGDPDSAGVQINGNFTIASLGTGDSATVTVNHSAVIGLNQIFVVVDPPLATNGSISESNESNNIANLNFNVGLFQVFAGQSGNGLRIADSTITAAYTWNLTNVTGSKVFVADSDSSLTFTSLQAIGLNTTNGTSVGTNDFVEIDTEMNTSHLTDSVNFTFTSGGQPEKYMNITSFKRLIIQIPAVNSTTTDSFQTGILWDSADGGGSYNGSQDIAFVTEMNQSKAGQYGTYDYEITIPATLRDYISGGGTVTFYTELR